jgi:HEAT repeat protein
MNDTLAGLLEILTQGSPDHQVAAAQVLADLRPREAEVARALATVLENGNHFLKPYALDALAAIRSPAALRAMVPVLQWDGELRERAVRALASLGAAAERSLVKEFGQGTADTRLAVVKICARTRGSGGLELLKKTLIGSDESLAEAARSLAKPDAADRVADAVLQVGTQQEPRT